MTAPTDYFPTLPALQYWRVRRNMSQQELADKIKMARSTVAALEGENRPARLSTVRKLAEALRVRPTVLTIRPPSQYSIDSTDG